MTTLTIVLTGACGGIGRALAVAFASAGHNLVLIGRNPDALAALREGLERPRSHRYIVADLSSAEAITELCSDIADGSAIDVLVNNAGIGSPKPLHETDDDTLDHFLGIMLRAPFRLARDVIVHMKSGSAIVNVTSTFAVIGGRRGGAYSAAKGGLTSLTMHMACEYGPQGIRSNCVAPGVTMTDMVRARFDDPGFQKMNVDTTPYPRLGEVEDIASTIAFLCLSLIHI